jgi:hypothetical protein
MNANQTYITFNFGAVLVALGMLALSIWLAPVNLATKGYWGMGVLLLTGSLVNLVKYRMDERMAEEMSSKLEKARNEKLINDYVGRE